MTSEPPRVFSVRLVSIDHYMAPPIPGFDDEYSSFQGGMINEVPVIRVFGPTPGGQKTCLHIHKVFPYLYFPIPDIRLDDCPAKDAAEKFANSVAVSLDNALQLKGVAGSKKQHVHGFHLVRAKKFYGYHSGEELFVKIYFYYPRDVSRAANLLLGGAVLDKIFQPHESHIPYILQFLVDYNLNGMSLVHLTTIKFRQPVPNSFKQTKLVGGKQNLNLSVNNSCIDSSNLQENEYDGEQRDSSYWLSSNIPDGWLWQIPPEPEMLSSSEFTCVQRQSNCELEGDAIMDDIINQQFKNYMSQSQAESGVKMVQSLIPIWEEEYNRTGLTGEIALPDSSKPLPRDTLRTLLNMPDYDEKFHDLCFKEDRRSSVKTSADNFHPAAFFAGTQTLDSANFDNAGLRADFGSSSQQVADIEALELLRWLAVSQSANEIDSDDDLARETILSPLFREAKFDKVMEKANSYYISDSQRECQDILDSIEGLEYSGSLKESAAIANETESELEMKSFGVSDCVGYQRSVRTSSMKESPWGSLPLSTNFKDFPTPETANVLLSDKIECSNPLNRRAQSSMEMSGCSVRDLMRKKRRHRVIEQAKVSENGMHVEDSDFPRLDFYDPDFSAHMDVLYVGPNDNRNYDSNCDLVNRKSSTSTENEEQEPVADKTNIIIPSQNANDVHKYYQNDGSLLFLLTSSLAPPSTESVSKWLLNDKKGTSGVAAQFSPSEDDDEDIAESCSATTRNFLCDPVQIVEGYKITMSMHDENGSQEMNMANNEKTASSCDISQISGPSQSSLTAALSQTGFRDPASVAAVQMLTLISVEIMSESRADLRPDPLFDAINIITLVIQNDSESELENVVLVRSNTTSFQMKPEMLPDCNVKYHSDEKSLFTEFVKIINTFDPDILVGWDVQSGSIGFLAERAAHLGFGLLSCISRIPNETRKGSVTESFDQVIPESGLQELLFSSSPVVDDAVDEWGRTHVSGVHVNGRIVINLWRLIRSEVKLAMYTLEAVVEGVLRKKIPSISNKVLTKWFHSGPMRAQYKCFEYITRRTKLNLEILNQLDIVNRTSELARVFGIEFFAVISRGSQYRVESMLLRLAHTRNFLAISPGSQQVAGQPAMECLPLVMEPESGFYRDPVVVLDFQSLYPSMIIAYNLCFSTCLGNVEPSKYNTLGVCSYSPDSVALRELKNDILLTPNGVMYVPRKIREGVLPRLLDEILSTRIMVKQAIKKLPPSEHVRQRIFNARQLALKLIANVTYGYTAAGFSGRMPCAELADSIVQCGRRTLEKAIALVHANDNWNAKVVYGDTDSLFVLLKGRTRQEAFEIGQQIASAVSAMNPHPVTLKLEKVYHPCFLLTKKRYVGYSYESRDQAQPKFDAKGIETVRRDSCGVVSKMMEKSLRLFFESQNISEVKAYLHRQWQRILSGRVSLQDFVFAKEVRLGTYSTRSSSSLPPAAIVATKAMKGDPRAEPRYAERVPYVVVHGEPGARLVDMVADPLDLLEVNSPLRLNDVYYINKQIIPALQRVFGLVGADLSKWFREMPRHTRETSGKRPLNPSKTRIDYYYLSRHCALCGEMVNSSTQLCDECMRDEASAATALIGRCSKLEKELHSLAAICRHCGGGDWVVESGVKCTSLACSVFYERRKVQRQLQAVSAIAASKGMYPPCFVEWF